MKEKLTVILSVVLAFVLAGGLMINPDALSTELFTDAAYAADSDGNDATEDEDAVPVDLNTVTENVYEITKKGTYRLSGEYAGQIRIEVADDKKVKLILDGVTLNNENDAAILCVSAEKLVISTADGSENSISVSGEYAVTDDSNVDGAIFSKSDLTLNGNGVLNIISESGHGIVSKDTLKLKSGTVNVVSGGKGLSGKDGIEMEDGTLSVIADDDALNSGEDIEISGGTMNLSSGDDGIHADEELEVSGGTVYVKESYEGFEALKIHIKGGIIDITSSDDGINTAGGADESGTFGRFGGGDPFQSTDGAEVVISGGTVTVDAEGDGIDSNGSLEVSGGELYISGPFNTGNGAIDYATYASVSGGIVVAAGSSDMAEGFGSDSAQGSILYNFSTTYDGGTAVVLKDSEGNVLTSFAPSRSFSSVVVSAPGLESSGTYCLQTGEDEVTVEMDGITWSNNGFGMGGGMPGSGMGAPGMAGQETGEQGNFNAKGGMPGGFGRNMNAPGGPGGFGGGKLDPAAYEENQDGMSDSSDPNGQENPGMNNPGMGGPNGGQGGMPGGGMGGSDGFMDGFMNGMEPGWSETAWQALLDNSIITEETFDAVSAYFTEKFENMSQEGAGTEPPEKPDGTQNGDGTGMENGMQGMQPGQGGQPPEVNGSMQPGQGGQPPEMNGSMQPGQGEQPPEKPDGEGNGTDGQNMTPPEGLDGDGSAEPPELPEGSEYMGITTQILDELLENEVILQDIYDAIAAVLPEMKAPQQS